MSKRTIPKPPGRGRAPPSLDDPPLIRVLIAESARRAHTFEQLAKELGVSYARFAQWRRGEANVANSRRSVLQAAAKYLDVPTAFVLCLAGLVTADDLVRPAQATMAERLRRVLERIRIDPAWAGFFPDSLMQADPEVQRFVALLYRELIGPAEERTVEFEWMKAIHRASMGDAQAQAELAGYRKDAGPENGLF